MATFSKDDVKRVREIVEKVEEEIKQVPKIIGDHAEEVHKFNAPILTENVDSLEENLNGTYVNNLKQFTELLNGVADGMHAVLVAGGEV